MVFFKYDWIKHDQFYSSSPASSDSSASPSSSSSSSSWSSLNIGLVFGIFGGRNEIVDRSL